MHIAGAFVIPLALAIELVHLDPGHAPPLYIKRHVIKEKWMEVVKLVLIWVLTCRGTTIWKSATNIKTCFEW